MYFGKPAMLCPHALGGLACAPLSYNTSLALLYLAKLVSNAVVLVCKYKYRDTDGFLFCHYKTSCYRNIYPAG